MLRKAKGIAKSKEATNANSPNRTFSAKEAVATNTPKLFMPAAKFIEPIANVSIVIAEAA